jgi:hypothetical protein
MYEPQRQAEDGGCRETLLLTRAVFGVLGPPLAVAIVVVLLVGFAIFLYSRHPALALIPIAVLVIGALLFARWDQRRHRPPEL